MSTFACPVVQIEKAGKHPNADSLSITQIGGYNVIFKTEDFKVGDLVVFVPEESLVPQTPEWEFLYSHRIKEGKEVREKDRVVRARRLRGIFSCGIITKIPEVVFFDDLRKTPKIGDDYAVFMGITKYEPPEQVGSGGDNSPQQGWFLKFTEIENARGPVKGLGSRSERLVPGEEVVLTEKIHGANARYVLHDGTFFIGSHVNVKHPESINWWTHVSKKLDMEAKARKIPEHVLFGEVYGQVQKGYEYGLKSPTFVLFDIYSLREGKYMDWDHLVEAARELELPLVPLLYKGPWVSLEHASQFADGPTVLGNGVHIREGCVIRTVPERWDQYIGRMCLKIVGEGYLLKKGKE